MRRYMEKEERAGEAEAREWDRMRVFQMKESRVGWGRLRDGWVEEMSFAVDPIDGKRREGRLETI